MKFVPTLRDRVCILFSNAGDEIREFIYEHNEFGFEVMDIVTDLINAFLNNWDLEGVTMLSPVEISLHLNLQDEFEKFLKSDERYDKSSIYDEEDDIEDNYRISWYKTSAFLVYNNWYRKRGY